MAHTAVRAPDSEILGEHAKFDFSIGKYLYVIASEGNERTYRVSDGTRTLSAKLTWAFGTGRVGQSYLFKKEDGNFYEARVTYFGALKNLHFTPSRALTSPEDLELAMDRPVELSEVKHCFACHTTGSTFGGEFQEQTLTPGIHCEACHGTGAKHVAAANVASIAGIPEEAQGTIFNAARLSPVSSVDFCGACHGAFWDVKLTGAKGVSTAKSQPFRLEESKCWGKAGDARLTCISCHDPHKPLQTELKEYDQACFKCHVNAGEKPRATLPGHACPVGTSGCASCHMPKVEIPEMHYAFTDHRIRIVPPGSSYPD